jgi:hypothetical protein
VGWTAVGGGNDVLLGGAGIDGITGDSRGLYGDVSGAGNDVINAGEDGAGTIIGDSFAETVGATASGVGNDIIDLSPDGSFNFVIGDHNSAGGALGAGNDLIIGGSADELIAGDNSPNFGYA